MNREQAQAQLVELSKTHKYIIAEFSTGVGKTLAAIKIIEDSKSNWNIVIAETNHEQNWIDEFNKHSKSHLLKDVKFFCYQSLHKNLNGENYVFDEIHHAFSDRRIKLLEELKNTNLKRLIGLSATLSRTQHEKLQNVLGNVYTFKIGLSEAISSGILPEPELYFVGVKLDNTMKNHRFEFNKVKYVMCTEQEMYDRMSDKVEWLKDRYMQSREEFHKISWLKYANDRKKFLSDCKTRHARIMLNKLNDKRLICFTGSIKQSELLSKGLSIHSKLPKEDRVKLIQDFNSGKINQLFATQMLKEGMNLNNIEAGLIIQLDNVERYLVQVLGRTLRAIAPLQYVLYVRNTQDEKYVENVTINFDKEHLKFITIEEL